MARFYVQRGDKTFGPFQSSQLKQLADSGKVTPSDMIRQGEDGEWYSASEVKGLFLEESSAAAPVVDSGNFSPLELEGLQDAGAVVQNDSLPPVPVEETQSATDNSNLRACPDCEKMVSKRAVTCPSCGAPFLFDVILTGFGDSFIPVIRAVREVTGLGLKEAKELVESAPATLKLDWSWYEANRLVEHIEAAGGAAIARGR